MYYNITTIIPAYNEESTISEVVETASENTDQVMVIDDGSEDRTVEKVKQLNLPNVDIIQHENNKGKAEAVKTGVERVNNPYIIFLDADLMGLKKGHIYKLIETIKPNKKMAIGLHDGMAVPGLSGQRIVETSIVKHLVNNSLWEEYNMEIIMNNFVKRNFHEIPHVQLPGLKHVTKVRKWGVGSLFDWMREFSVCAYIYLFLYMREKTINSFNKSM